MLSCGGRVSYHTTLDPAPTLSPQASWPKPNQIQPPGTATGQYTLFALCSTITNPATVENPCNVQRRMDELQGYSHSSHPLPLSAERPRCANVYLLTASQLPECVHAEKCHICSLRIRVFEWDVWKICSCLDTLHNGGWQQGAKRRSNIILSRDDLISVRKSRKAQKAFFLKTD
jgi:hypothetical protein